MNRTKAEQFSRIPLVSVISLIVVFTSLLAVQPVWTMGLIRAAHRFVTSQVSSWYVLSVALCLVLALYLAFSRYSHMIIGTADELPRFTTAAWITLLVSAGLTLGVLFLGVSEVIVGFAAPSTEISPYTAEAAREAMQTGFLQWGLHMWAVAIVTGLAVCWFAFRRGVPMRLSAATFPILGFRSERWAGHIIDAVAVIATLVAAVAALVLVAAQTASGFASVFGMTDSSVMVLVSLLVITALPMVLVLFRRHRQLQLIRRPAVAVVAALVLLVLLVGPGNWLLSFFSTSVGGYFSELPATALGIGAVAGGNAPAEQSLFYWAFWIIWAPFTGVFLVSVSRGRTIRSFIVATLSIPMIATLFVIAVLAGAALFLELEQGVLIADRVAAAPESALFLVLGEYRLGVVLRLLALIAVAAFGVIMMDSGSWFLTQISLPAGSPLRTSVRVLWLVLTGVLAAVLLVAGGLHAVRSLVVIAALPVIPLLLLALAGFMKALRFEQGRVTASLKHKTAVQSPGHVGMDTGSR